MTICGPPTAKPEDSLAARLKAADPQALSDAYDLYRRLAFVVIVKIVRDASVAEDLVQETFLRVWSHAEQVGDTFGTIGPWLLAIARNCARDYIKSRAAKFARSKSISDSDVSPITIDHEIQASEQERLLKAAFQSLTAPQRQVIEMAYYEGLSQQEIADRLHEPLGTIKSRTRLALQRLRSRIEVKVVCRRG